MRRADRLFEIIQWLRSRRVTTAQWLAEKLEVSERTIYRDIQDLMSSGVPIEGEAGVGYALRKGFDLPPLMFNREELAALSLGAQIIRSWADPKLADAAERVLSKIEVILPDELKDKIENTRLYSPMVRLNPKVANVLASLRLAIDQQNKVSIDYQREDGQTSHRTVWPLGLFFWGTVWTLGSWCELRESFRNFRLDRIRDLTTTDENYPLMEGRTLNDLLRECNKEEGYETM
ncbi:MAG: YafY family transcriptional regulator [Gammaproteobacteria bacterium]|nr:YafY family transcriptional regulator [Gammaproteobacteria bacterium]